MTGKGKGKRGFVERLAVITPKALSYGMRSQGISQFYLHTPHSFGNGMNHTWLCLSPKLVLIYLRHRQQLSTDKSGFRGSRSRSQIVAIFDLQRPIYICNLCYCH